MKIGIIIRCCRTHGSSRYVSEVVKEFVKNNEVHVFTNNWDPLNTKVKIHKIPTISNNFYIYEASFNFFSTLITKFHKFDVMMAQPTRYFTPDVGYMQFVYKAWADYKKRNNLPLYFGDKVLPIIEKINVKRTKKIIVMSNVLKEEVMKFYNVPEEKITVIYSGVNSKEFNPENRKLYNESIRKELGIEKNDIVLLFVGNPYRRKGLNYAIEALSKIKKKNIKLLIMGKDLGKDLFENYMKIARKLNVADKIIHGGFKNDIYKYFSVGNIFLLPTLYEPFGLVITEALASGMPAVVSRCAGAGELVIDGKTGMLIDNPKDSNEISKKLNYIINNNLFRKMGGNARKSMEKYTWKKTTEEMLKIFQSIKKTTS